VLLVEPAANALDVRDGAVHEAAMSQESEAPGWDAIDRALQALYAARQPLHWAPPLHGVAGGNDPLAGVSAWRSTFGGRPHWHYVSYGFTDLYSKETDVAEVSGYGFELTMRVVDPEGGDDAPTWPVSVMQNLGRYVFSSGNPFGAGHHLPFNGPIALGRKTELVAGALIKDPQLAAGGRSPFGSFEFLQLVGLTQQEYDAIYRWDTHRFLDAAATYDPALLTDLPRGAWLKNPDFARLVAEGTARDGSSMTSLFMSKGELHPGPVPTWGVAANSLGGLETIVRGRLGYERDVLVGWREGVLRLRPGAQTGFSDDGDFPTLTLSKADQDFLSALPQKRGDYPGPSGKLVVRVLPVDILDGARKKVMHTIG
jgi:hypothetical protein